ncbi:MAG: hypothetical protein K2K16_12975 [Ruminococcus sp.]|nr:hypothetical protein [Ruminococcus sp.]MDE6673083.1 hypothetical protein [Ruminococcus sp.]
MPNPIFNMMNRNTRPNMQTIFRQFMGQMRGKNPDKEINDLISRGEISQAQLNQIQAQARQMQSLFDGMKKMFGF